jgi:trans-2-enoyl-CoA reductase
MLKSIKSLFLNGPARLQMKERSLQSIGSGQFLVEMHYAPMNPSDFYFVYNAYHDRKDFPCVAGFEGIGRVLAVGNNDDEGFIGRRIACHFFGTNEGAYSSHAIVDKNHCIFIEENTDICNFPFLVNPITAIGLYSFAKQMGAHSFVQNGASTSVGKLILFLNLHEKLKSSMNSINIVRNISHTPLLSSLGANIVLDQTSPDFKAQLRSSIREYAPIIGFDSLAGDHTGILLNAMPDNSTLCVYGALDIRHCGSIDPQELIFTGKGLRGFHAFRSFLGNQPLSILEGDLNQIYKKWKENNPPKVFALEDYASALRYFKAKNEKVIFRMNSE